MNNQTIQKLKEILLKKRKSIIQINKINNFIWNDLTQRYSTNIAALCALITILVQIYQIPNWTNKYGVNSNAVVSILVCLCLNGLIAILLFIYIFIERKHNIKIKENKFTNNKFIKTLVLMLYFLFILSMPFSLPWMPFVVFSLIPEIFHYIFIDALPRIF